VFRRATSSRIRKISPTMAAMIAHDVIAPSRRFAAAMLAPKVASRPASRSLTAEISATWQ